MALGSAFARLPDVAALTLLIIASLSAVITLHIPPLIQGANLSPRLPPANGPTPEGPSPPRAHGSAAAYALGGFFQVSRNEASRFGWSGRWFQWM
ncbi:hypothetical protein V2W45_1341189 [Cenococcum geophilum]